VAFRDQNLVVNRLNGRREGWKLGVASWLMLNWALSFCLSLHWWLEASWITLWGHWSHCKSYFEDHEFY